jgi:2-methylcitrate dehydratase PrpD
MNHPSEAVCPAIWALGEQRRSSGKEIILAHIIGVEIADKIAAGIKPGFVQKGWEPPCVLGTFGAASAAGKILCLNAVEMANALGIAGQQASGMRGNKGSMAKAYRAGRAAENGVVAATLAQMGFTGSAKIMETRDGFLQTFGDGADGEKILRDLGHPFEFIAPGITLKPYPSCTSSHTAITGVLRLKKEQRIDPEEVVSVECSVSPLVADFLKFQYPRNKFEAKYSMPFCVATALIDGKVVIKSFSDEKVKDPKIVELMKRVKMVVSPELAKLGYNPEIAPVGCTVTIKLRNGKEHLCRMDKGPWEPETPPSWDELADKYRSCAELVLKPEAIEESVDIIQDIEKAENLCRLMDLVRG